jgi:hypothetical protein
LLVRSLHARALLAFSRRWGGAASTTFFCDPNENMYAVLMTALRFNDNHRLPLTQQLKQLCMSCIADDPAARL